MKKITKRKSLIATAIATLCIAFLPILSLGVTDNNSVPDVTPPAQTVVNDVRAAAPLRGYSTLRVSADANYAITVGKTTVGGLKKNLVVEGTTGTGTSLFADNNTFVLNGSEYDVIIKGADLSDVDVISEAMVDGKTDESAGYVDVIVVSNGHISGRRINVKASEELTGALSFGLKTGVTKLPEDCTPDTAYRFLDVKMGDTALTPDLYNVSFNPANIYGKSSVDVTVTYALDNTKKATNNLDVSQSVLKGVYLTVDPKFTLQSDNTYKDADGNDAFVASYNHQKIFKNLLVYAVFDNGIQQIPLTDDDFDQGYLPMNGKVSTTFTDLAEGRNSIPVTVKLGGVEQNATIEIFAAAVKVTSIDLIPEKEAELEAWRTKTGRFANTVLDNNFIDELSGFFKLMQNSGVPTEANSSRLDLVGTLAPDPNSTPSSTETYSKTIKLVAKNNPEVFKTVTIENIIQSRKPISFGTIVQSQSNKQLLHHAVNYEGWSVSVNYNQSGTAFAEVPLSEFPADAISVSLGSADEFDDFVPQDTKVINADTRFVKFTLRFGDLSGEVYRAISPEKDLISLPTMEVGTIDYSEDYCFKTFEGFDPAAMTLSVTNAETGAVLTEGEDKDYVLNATEKRVYFKSGGMFNVIISLKENVTYAPEGHGHGEFDISEYKFDTEKVPSYVSSSGDTSVTYPVQVLKGLLSLSLENIADETTGIVYGDDLAAFIKVTGSAGGRTYTLKRGNGNNCSALGDGLLEMNYKLVIYKTGEDTYNPNDYKNIDSYRGYTENSSKRNAGTYRVYVITDENIAYTNSQIAAVGGIDIEIKQREISLSVSTGINYDRNAHGVNEFIASGNNFATGDNPDEVLSIKYTSGGVAGGLELKDGNFVSATHAGDYNVTVNINSAYTANYKFADGTNANQVFTIGKHVPKFKEQGDKDQGFSWATGFEYGDSTGPKSEARTEGTFYPTVNAVEYYNTDASGKKTGVKIDLTTKPFETWDKGTYIAYYGTALGKGNNSSGTEVQDLASDYNCPTLELTFEVTPKAIDKVTVTGWSNTENNYVSVGTFEDTVTVNLTPFPSPNAANGANIVTVITSGERFDTEAAIDTSALPKNASTFTLTEAGNYTITIKLNSNFTWRVNAGEPADTDDIVYYGKIDRLQLTNPTVKIESESDVYDGNAKSFKVELGVRSWNKDVADILSVTKTLQADTTVNVNHENGTFTAKRAGEFTVTVEIKDKNNYTWSDGQDNKTCKTTIKRRRLEVEWKKADGTYVSGTGSDYPIFNYIEGGGQQTLPNYRITNGVTDDTVTVKASAVHIYDDENFNTLHTGNVTTADTFYIIVTDIEGEDYQNYYVPDMTDAAERKYVSIRFDIVSKGLKFVELTNGTKSVEETYSGEDYDFTKYIKDYLSLYTSGSNNEIKRLEITVDTGIAYNAIKDVKLDGNNVAVYYNIIVQPAANYKWTDGTQEPYAFRFKVKQLPVNLTWVNKDTEVPFTDGNFVYGDKKDHTPAVLFNNVVNRNGAPEAELTLSYTRKDGAAAGNRTEAGEYTATVSLAGDYAKNYTLTGVTTAQAFTVKKAVLNVPTASTGGLTYDGSIQTVTYGDWTTDKKFADMITGNVTGTMAGVPTQYQALGNCEFNNANGELTFLHAGEYTVTFTLNETARKNYCWTAGNKQTAFDSGVETETTVGFTVNRLGITAPALAYKVGDTTVNERAIELIAGQQQFLPTLIVEKGTVGIDRDGNELSGGFTYGHTYGSVSGTKFDVYTDGTPSSTTRGNVYYIRLQLNGGTVPDGATFSPYDVMWQANTKDTLGLSYITQFDSDIKKYGFVSDDGISITLHFVITKQQVGASFTFEGYTYGDNGEQSSATRSFIVPEGSADGQFHFNDFEGENGFKLTFGEDPQYPGVIDWIKQTNPKVLIAFLTSDDKPVPADDMVNGLPWNAGTYKMTVKVDFIDKEDPDYEEGVKDDNYNDFDRTVVFRVLPRLVEVKWNDTDNSHVYDGDEHYRAVEVNNGIIKTGSDAEKPELTVKGVTNVVWDDAAGGEKAQTVTITNVASANYYVNDYTYTDFDGTKKTLTGLGADKKNRTFTILQKEVTLSATDKAHVYGDELPTDLLEKNVTGEGFIESNYKSLLKVKIVNAEGNEIGRFADAGGTYYIVPGLKDAKANYKLGGTEADRKGTFTVAARKIKVEIQKESGKTKATSVYNQDLTDLYSVATVTTTNGATAANGIVSGNFSDVFTLSLPDGFNKTSPITDANHSYAITIALNGGVTNYEFDGFDHDNFNEFYILTPAEITNVKVDGYNEKYDGGSHPWFIRTEATVQLEETNKPVYQYQEAKKTGNAWNPADENGWFDYIETSNLITNVKESKSYHVRVVATNHDPKYFGVVPVSVSEETLIVSATFTIYFGEEGPEHKGENGGWFKTKLSDLSDSALAMNGVKIYSVQGLVDADKNKLADIVGGSFGVSYADGVTYTAGDDAKTYALKVVSGLTADNYKFEAGVSVLKVLPLPISVKLGVMEDSAFAEKTAFTAVYNQENPDSPVADVTTLITSSYGTGDTVVVFNGNNAVTVATDALKSNDDKTTNDVKLSGEDIVGYDITVALINGNYTFADGGKPNVKYTITRADNRITTEGYSLFVEADSYNGSAAVDKAAWVYGDYSDVFTDGYNKDGKQQLKPLAMLFDGDKLIITVKRGTTELGKATGTDIQALFDQIAGQKNELYFNAGDYTVIFVVAQSKNYNVFNETWKFKVDKRTLTVTPDAQTGLNSVTYGEDAGAFTNGEVALPNSESLADVVEFEWGTNYAKGYEGGSVGNYTIYVDKVNNTAIDRLNDNTYKYTVHDNYAVEFKTAVLNVVARKITIEIQKKENFFNLVSYKDGRYVEEEEAKLTFKITAGSFAQSDLNETPAPDTLYESGVQNVFTLYTEALTNADSKYSTNDAGEYSIYAVYNAEYLNRNNYDITITSDGGLRTVATSEHGTVVNSDKSNAALFNIKKSVINMAFEDLPYKTYDEETDTYGDKYSYNNAYTYDGYSRYYKPNPELPTKLTQSGITIPGSLQYYNMTGGKTPIAVTDVKNVGTYRVEFVSTDNNYETATAGRDFSIEKREINITNRATTSERTAISTSDTAYYFNGGNITRTISYGNLADGESINLTSSVTRSVRDGQSIGALSLESFMTCETEVLSETKQFRFTVRNAGNYTVTVELADSSDGKFLASNYTLSSSLSSYDFSVLLETLTVDVEKTSVQYGSPLTDTARFNKITPVYTVQNLGAQSSTDATTRNLLKEEKEKGYLAFSGNNDVFGDGYDYSGAKFDYSAALFGSNYTVGSSEWGKTYNLYLKEGVITAYNFTVTRIGSDNLSIAKREVSITVLDADANNGLAKHVYEGRQKDHNDYLRERNVASNISNFYRIDDGVITGTTPVNYSDPRSFINLSVETTAVNVGKHNMTATQNGGAMYKITFDKAVYKYEIVKRTLTVAVVSKSATGGYSFVDNGNSVRVVYGSAVSYNGADSDTFKIVYSGWADDKTTSNMLEGTDDGSTTASGTNVNITVKSDFGGYTPWITGYSATSYLTVTAENKGGDYSNYNVVFVTTKLYVDQLTISVASAPVTYTEEKNGDGSIKYNGGAYGINHAANLTFTYGNGLAIEADYLPVYTATYATSRNGSYSATAPNRAGDYFTKVKLPDSGNYIFDSGYEHAPLEHKINRQQIKIFWADTEIGNYNTDDTFTNRIDDFRSSLMAVDTFVLTVNGTNSPADRTKLQLSDTGLVMTEVYDAGTFTISLSFNAAAWNNYQWIDDGDRPMTENSRSISFRVVAGRDSIRITSISVNDWTYNEDASEATATLNYPALSDYITFTYAPYGSEPDQTVDGWRYVADNTVSQLTYSVSAPKNAGWYVVKAYFAGSADYGSATDYYLVKINKAKVDAPVFMSDNNETYTDSTGKFTYDGTRLNVNVKHSSDVRVSSFTGDYANNSTGSALYATRAGEYEIGFVLVDNANYEWKNGTPSLTWKIAQSKNNVITWEGDFTGGNDNPQYSTVYGNGYAISARATFTGAVTLLYANGDGVNDPSTIADEGWSTTRKSDAGAYYVKAISYATSDYCSPDGGDTVSYAKLFIDKGRLYLTANGSMTYGELFNDEKDSFEVTTDVANVRASNLTGAVSYVLDVDDFDPAATVLNAGSYDLKIEVNADNTVKGVTHSNYYVYASDNVGKLTVGKKSVTVQIGDTASVYGEKTDVNAAGKVELRVLGESVDVAQLYTTLTTTATETSNVGRYRIDGTSDTTKNINYSVTYISGWYSVNPCKICVDYSAKDSYYKETVAEPITVNGIYATNMGNDKVSLGTTALTFEYRYTGRTNEGREISRTTYPDVAGSYLVTIIGIQDNTYGNYELDLDKSNVSVPFTIRRQVIDADTIVIQPKEYTGAAQRPDIADTERYEVIFPEREFVEVGLHYFTLRLKDSNNYQWKSVEGSDREVAFRITKASNALVSSDGGTPTIEIKGWTFGQYDSTANAPKAQVKYGDIEYMYSKDGVTYTNALPSDWGAGEYFVRVTVYATDDFDRFDSAPVKFTIDKVKLSAPTLEINNTNNVFTGEVLNLNVNNIDNTKVGINFGNIERNGGKYVLHYTNAGAYEATVFIIDKDNYEWASDVLKDGDGNAVLQWNVAKKVIAQPKKDNPALMVNGSILEFFPEGFDSSLMTITDNQSGYGGEFTAYVTLIDPDNYEWEGTTEITLPYTWKVLGANVLFGIIIGSIGGADLIAAAVAIVLFVKYRQKRRLETEEPKDEKDEAEGGAQA